jgi:hypothetical protein
MKRLKLVSVPLALLTLAAMTSEAVGSLPDASVALSGNYPIHAQAVGLTNETQLSTASGPALTGTGVTLLLLTKELSALGTFDAVFTKVRNSEGIECHSTGDATGVVLVSGEFHIGNIFRFSLIRIGWIFLILEFEAECPGGISVLLRGDVVGGANNIGSEATELTGFGAVLEGKEGIQTISEYYNNGGTRIKAKLEVELGAGFVAADENITGELGLSVLGSQMIVITNR